MILTINETALPFFRSFARGHGLEIELPADAATASSVRWRVDLPDATPEARLLDGRIVLARGGGGDRPLLPGALADLLWSVPQWIEAKRQRLAAELQNVPYPGGGGLNPSLVRYAGLYRDSGQVGEDEFIEMMERHTPPGGREVKRAEHTRAYRKAFALTSKPAEKRTSGDASGNTVPAEVFGLLVRRGRGIDLRSLSPRPIPAEPNLQAVAVLHCLFRPEESVFIGSRYDTRVRPLVEWIAEMESGEAVPAFVIPAALSGEAVTTSDGKQSTRCDGAVTDRKAVLLEFDGPSLEDQLAFAAALISEGLLPVLAVTASGGKSIHVLVKVQDESDVTDLFAAIESLGGDTSNANPSRLSRLAGHLRKSDGKPPARQELLYINPEAGAVLKSGERITSRLARVMPEVDLPGHTVTRTGAPHFVSLPTFAGECGRALASNGYVFTRGGSPVVATEGDGGAVVSLSPLIPPRLAAIVEKTVRPMAAKSVGRGEVKRTVRRRSNVSEALARLTLAADDFASPLPPIRAIASAPVLVEEACGGGLRVAGPGYDRDSGVWAGGGAVDVMSAEEAFRLLRSIIQDFKFRSASDESRAIASILGIAATQGDLLRGGRVPAVLIEADESQTGKGYLARVACAVFCVKPGVISQRSRGVGGFEESFSAVLVEGHSVIMADNLRDNLDSPGLESALTEPTFLARVPYGRPIACDMRRVAVIMTSNGLRMTRDLANRLLPIRLVKQPRGYIFRRYPEGGLLQHIERNRHRLLGAVCAIWRAWAAAGRQECERVGHDFRDWLGPMRWLIEDLGGMAPLLAGVDEVKDRWSSLAHSEARGYIRAIQDGGRMGEELSAGDIATLLGHDTDPDGNQSRAIGRVLGAVFRTQEAVDTEDHTLTKIERHDPLERRPVKRYILTHKGHLPNVSTPGDIYASVFE